jgi:hypothetical protein
VGVESVTFISIDSSNPAYPPNPSPTLTVCVINSGINSNLQFSGVLLNTYDGSHKPLSTTSYSVLSGVRSAAPVQSGMKNLNDGASLLAGEEGYFVIKLPPGTSLAAGQYAIQLITKSGSSFEYSP